MKQLADFNHFVEIIIRYGDIDMLNHVNNSKYLTYLETARISYANNVLGWDGNWEKPDTILAKAEITYRKPLKINDKLQIYIRCSHIGPKSLEFQYLFLKNPLQNPQIAATAYTLMITYDPENERTIPVSDSYRQKIMNFEPAFKK